MDDALRLLATLRRFQPEELSLLIAERQLPPRGERELIDGVEWLLSERHIDAALARLGWRACRELAAREPAALREARRLGLAADGPGGAEADPELLQAVRERLGRLELGWEPPPAADAAPAPVTSIERALTAGMLAADLLDLLGREPHAARGTAPALTASEIRPLAAELAADPGELATLSPLMARAGLLGTAGGDGERLHAPTASGIAFLAAPAAQRWATLAEAWLDGLALPGPDGPLTDPAAASGARLLGIADEPGRVHEAGRAVLRGDLAAAERMITAQLPQPVAGAYVQADLTVIAPGPLSARDEADLRRVARIEQRGIATISRIDAGAVEQALSAGASERELLDALEHISLTGVPQPVSYLIESAAREHGRVRVRAEGNMSIVRTLDPALLRRIEADQALAPLGLRPRPGGTLMTPAPARTALTLLRDARYPAVAEDEDGTPRTPAPPIAAPPGPREFPEAVVRLAAAWHEASSADDGEDEHRTVLRRRLELARRQKRRVRLRITMPGGAPRELVLVPTSVLPERVRGRDAAAEMERTLPLSAITELDELPAARGQSRR